MSGHLEILKSLDTAEAFLEYFGIAYDQRVVDVNRLHILQRLHDRLAEADLEGMDDIRVHDTVAAFLAGAYQDFVVSDARTEKVFKVFHRPDETARPTAKTMVPLSAVRGAPPPDTA